MELVTQSEACKILNIRQGGTSGQTIRKYCQPVAKTGTGRGSVEFYNRADIEKAKELRSQNTLKKGSYISNRQSLDSINEQFNCLNAKLDRIIKELGI